MATPDYRTKFETISQYALFHRLTDDQQAFIKNIAFAHRFTQQELRQIVEVSRDLSMWNEMSLENWWQKNVEKSALTNTALKKHLFRQLRKELTVLKSQAKSYSKTCMVSSADLDKNRIRIEKSDKKIFGYCPVASEKTLCCNLYTIDAVENCSYGCSYCSIQTFYQGQITFDQELASKLKKLNLDKNHFYHIGTGQSSDSLIWGNRNGNLDALCEFAYDNPNILLEFKTKSDNIKYFLENPVPKNIVCSWSLNTETVIQNEEYLTVSLNKRLQAARVVADLGIKVAFHFHPMVYYDQWEQGYPAIAKRILNEFDSSEVLFVSFGSLTLIKSVIKKIREKGLPTKILQMELVSDPHGKQTYPDDIKVKMFKTMHEEFSPWKEKVLLYLCMEKAEIWQQAFGYVYDSNQVLELEFGKLRSN